MTTTMVFSGDWLVKGGPGGDAPPRYEVGYTGVPSGGWSGGANFRVTKDVMETFVADNEAMREAGAPIEPLRWDSPSHTYVVYASVDDPTFVQVLAPDPDGMYEVPSWTWRVVDPAACDRVVGADGTAATRAAGVTMTAGELMKHLAQFAPETPVTVGGPTPCCPRCKSTDVKFVRYAEFGGATYVCSHGGKDFAFNVTSFDWMNVDGATDPNENDEQSVILMTRDDFDTRQW